MSPRNIHIVFTICAVVWVGGWGFLMFLYPEFFATINARFGFRKFTSPRGIAFIRWVGIVEMALAGISVVSELVGLAFGLKSY
jgi:hypothetical protein